MFQLLPKIHPLFPMFSALSLPCLPPLFLREDNIAQGAIKINLLVDKLLVCKQVRLRYFSTTNRKYKYYRNKVQRKFITESPDLIWVSDITHVYVKILITPSE